MHIAPHHATAARGCRSTCWCTLHTIVPPRRRTGPPAQLRPPRPAILHHAPPPHAPRIGLLGLTSEQLSLLQRVLHLPREEGTAPGPALTVRPEGPCGWLGAEGPPSMAWGLAEMTRRTVTRVQQIAGRRRLFRQHAGACSAIDHPHVSIAEGERGRECSRCRAGLRLVPCTPSGPAMPREPADFKPWREE